jgi:hypothetical protein
MGRGAAVYFPDLGTVNGAETASYVTLDSFGRYAEVRGLGDHEE